MFLMFVPFWFGFESSKNQKAQAKLPLAHIARERSGLPPERVDSTGATQALKLVLAAGL